MNVTRGQASTVARRARQGRLPVFAGTPVPAALATGSTGRGQAQWRLEGRSLTVVLASPLVTVPKIVQRDCALRR